MAIDEKTLLEERKVLEEDFNTTKDRIVQVEKDLGIFLISVSNPIHKKERFFLICSINSLLVIY